jgi:hypothetical protein
MFAVLGLAALVCACAPEERSAAGAASPTAVAQQTAEAALRRVGSGNLGPEPTPTATVPPRPACADAVWWYEAGAHLGESLSVQGRVVHAYPRAAPDASLRFDLGQSYPDPTGLSVVVPTDRSAAAADAAWAGKMVCVRGRVAADTRGLFLATDSADDVRVLP